MIGIDLSGITSGGGPLVKLNLGGSYNVRKFPDDIASTPYFIVFRAINTSFSPAAFLGKNVFKKATVSGNSLGFNLGKAKFSVGLPSASKGFALPIPANLATSYNARYSNEPLGVTGDIGRRVGAGINMPEDFTAESIENSIKDAIDSANISSDDLKGAAAGGLISGIEAGSLAAAAATKILGGGNLAALTGAGAAGFLRGALQVAGIARNPHLATVFTGVDFRTHSFQYKLIAKNKSESDTLRDMIYSFKHAMAPSYTLGDHVFQYPNQFDISLAAGQYLFKFGRSVLTQFDVNYTGEGTPAFFEETGAPYSVTLNMTFQETEIVTKREVKQGR